MATSPAPVRLAAVADLHCGKVAPDFLRPMLTQVSSEADILALSGDLTDYGLPEEAETLAAELSAVRIPIVAVLGNHDYQSDQQAAVREILLKVGVKLLDGESIEVHGIGFAGAKGFAGGFGTRTLEPWGEQAIKRFVQEALDESLKLESALARLRVPQRVALLHYSPVQATVEGEPAEIFCFLGSSRLEEPLNRYGATMVFHGHAHRGHLEGATQTGIPVYNVSLPLLRRTFPEGPLFRTFQIEVRE
ncbi:MAG: metallophosphoesterase [Pirellulales bacterium]